jgi:hypothetical protein
MRPVIGSAAVAVGVAVTVTVAGTETVAVSGGSSLVAGHPSPPLSPSLVPSQPLQLSLSPTRRA